MGNDSSKGGGGDGGGPSEKPETKSHNIFEKIIKSAKPSSSKDKYALNHHIINFM